ncbi:MAG: LytTR family DNA-binding domain-containing protein [Bacteroidetes bacterium]|nr:LytTR family DNA-binding domain-containing protein [Bacteroidota bacterium]MBU1718974.1 LytTR family DNA-binding domain-containing protein [Bacteroidota bacterium]
MKVLIIEDEPFAQKELERILLKVRPDIRIVAFLDSVDESVDWLKSNPKPDLIFMDIQLSDGLSFRIFRQVDVTSPVIFTTAYNEYALLAFKVNSIDYLLKPIEEGELEAAISKYENLKATFGSQPDFNMETLKNIFQGMTKEYKTRFVATLGDQIIHLTTDQIAYFYSEDKVTFVLTTQKKKYILNNTLDQLEEKLDPAQFFRINRKYIARISNIASVNKYFNGKLKLKLQPETEDEVTVSREKAGRFLEWLGE